MKKKLSDLVIGETFVISQDWEKEKERVEKEEDKMAEEYHRTGQMGVRG